MKPISVLMAVSRSLTAEQAKERLADIDRGIADCRGVIANPKSYPGEVLVDAHRQLARCERERALVAQLAALLARTEAGEAALLRRTLLLTYTDDGVRTWIADADAKGQTLTEQLERAEMIAQLPPFFARAALAGSSPEDAHDA